MSAIDAAMGGLGGMFGLGITTLAALSVINFTNNMFRCNLCGYTHQDKNMVIGHVKKSHKGHPALKKKSMQRQTQQRSRGTGWVFNYGS